jgi:hypothetical protein
MDSISRVLDALIAGGTAGATAAASTMVMDAYQGLKDLVVGRLRAGGVRDDEAVAMVEQAADGRERLKEELTGAGVDEPTVAAAERLLALLKDKGKYHVTLHDAKGVLIGDHSTQHNTFN